jgi:hypothetical protein
MPKTLTWGSKPFGAKSPAKPKEPPAPRNAAYERMLCGATDMRVLVALRYEDDVAERTFGPDVVYHSPSGKVLADGTQMQNPAEPSKNNTFHCLEVGKIASARLIQTPYQPAVINRSDSRYRMGILCPL